jgi:secreted trypsin-like serine protease
MRRSVSFCAAFLLIVSAAHSQEFVPPTEPTQGDPQVIGAKAVSPASWPATYIFRVPSGGCTSTAIGDRVILTAAHCISDGSTGTVSLGDRKISVVCNHHPSYDAGNVSDDFALCLSSERLSGFAFENVGTSMAYPRLGQDIALLGYGCVKSGGTDASFGVLHVGKANIIRLPTADSAYTTSKGGAAVCFGDSGGAAYYMTRGGKGRIIIGVNSRGDINQYSFISSTSTQAFLDWAIQWSATKGAAICGIDVDATGCRP